MMTESQIVDRLDALIAETDQIENSLTQSRKMNFSFLACAYQKLLEINQARIIELKQILNQN